jgi:hypothetical protein
MITVKMDFDPGSPDLPPFIPWIARIDAKTHACQGISLRTGKECSLKARFMYIYLDGTYDMFCRNHLDTKVLNADLYPFGNVEEQQRCERWIKKNTTDSRGLLK